MKSFKEVAIARDGGSTIFEYDGRTFFLDWGIGSSTHGHIFHGRDRSGATVHEDLYKELRPLFSERFARLKKAENAQATDLKDSELPDANDTDVASMKDQIKTIGDLYEEGKDCLHTLPIGQFHGDEMKAHSRAFDVLRELRDIAAVASKRVEELEQWKKQARSVMTPILDYCTDKANAKRLGISLGYKIFDRVLEILKGYEITRINLLK